MVEEQLKRLKRGFKRPIAEARLQHSKINPELGYRQIVNPLGAVGDEVRS
jgi:hypothetical protein